jgi:stalled ribosome rescue protein Dom34
MTAQARAALWLDHHEARIFHVDIAGFDEHMLKSPQHHFHRHPKGPTEPHEHPDDMTHFFKEIAQALTSAEEILVMGPSTAKNQFVNYLRDHAPALAAKVIGVEPSDHGTDPQIVAHVKRHFRIHTQRFE